MSSQGLLTVFLDDAPLVAISPNELPCEKNPSAALKPKGSKLIFEEASGKRTVHSLDFEEGWCHLSIRVHSTLACQVDSVISPSSTRDPAAFSRGDVRGIRFQPFLIGGDSPTDQEMGFGLFRRGLHFSGWVSPGNLSLSGVCDRCARTFRLQSFHSGFAELDYFYSASGVFTLVVSANEPGAPDVWPFGAPDRQTPPDPTALARLEERLPKAPDGTAFSYLNPLRCPHCAAPYIDFNKHPEIRPFEIYGNTFFGTEPLRI